MSYLAVYREWIRADVIKHGFPGTIDADGLSKQLFARKAIERSDRNMVKIEALPEDKLLVKLFDEIMPQKGENAFNVLVEILREKRNCEQLDKLMKAKSAAFSSSYDYSATDLEMTQFELGEYLKECDVMGNFWCHKIRRATTAEGFVDVDVQEEFKSEGEKPVKSVDDVFKHDADVRFRRIIVQGDPGCGKTTYTNKIALDWANEDKYLRARFDLIFWLQSEQLKVTEEQIIKQFFKLGSPVGTFVDNFVNNNRARILLIMDGFDEFAHIEDIRQKAIKILNGRLYSHFTVILSSRESHLDHISNNNFFSLLVKGFNETSMMEFFDKQQQKQLEGCSSNLIKKEQDNEQERRKKRLIDIIEDPYYFELFRNPLICTIYCSLLDGGGDGRLKGDEKRAELLQRIFQQWDEYMRETKRGLDDVDDISEQTVRQLKIISENNTCEITETDKEIDKLIRFGLLIPKKVLEAGVGRKFVNKYTVINKLVVECLHYRILSSKKKK